MPRRLTLCAWGTLLLIAAGGCSESSSGAANDAHTHAAPATLTLPKTYSGTLPIKITCTTGMVAELARHVGGPHVAVASLMGEGVDPHLYKASPGDVRQLTSCDLILFSGLHLEGKMSDLLSRLGRKQPTAAVAEYLDPARRLRTAEGTVDPHAWFDVALWRDAALVVRDALVQFDPPRADDYRAAADRYAAELAALDDEVRGNLNAIPAERRVLVTAHDAFHYFGRAYDVEVRAIQGINTESEAGVSEVNALVDFLVERRLPAVFIESSVSDRNIRALVEGCAARGHTVRIGGQLYSDALGQPGTPGGTYVGMVRHNVDAIVQALAPPAAEIAGGP